jgi:4-amino-4-deoxy-L-arabinose transferase-like glycosyltransferase
MNRNSRWYSIGLFTAFIAAIGWKVYFLLRDVFPFNADEAIVGLMAKHILAGEHPLFFYGQYYMGSLDAYLVAGGFSLFGVHVWVIRFVQIMLYAAVISTTIYLSWILFHDKKATLFTGLLLAFPAVNLTLYTSVSLGGYNEALLFGNLILILGWWCQKRLRQQHRTSWLDFILLGFFMGVGLWANGLTLIYSLPVGAITLYALINRQINIKRSFSPFLFLMLGGFSGALPWIMELGYGNGFSLFTELFGSAVAVEGGGWLARTGQHILSYFILGLPATFGLRPPWSVEWLMFLMIPVAFFVWFIIFRSVTLQAMKQDDVRNGVIWLVLPIALFSIVFFTTSFGVDPSGRYFLPMMEILYIYGGLGLARVPQQKWVPVAIAAMVIFHAGGTLQCAAQNPPGITTQFYAPAQIDHSYMPELIRFLETHNERRGYSTYWISYPLAFLSNEELIFIPALPYHTDLQYTSRDNRYDPYNTLVGESDRTAYITSNNGVLDQLLEQSFARMGITWQDTRIGMYHVYYELSGNVSPQDLGLPWASIDQRSY